MQNVLYEGPIHLGVDSLFSSIIWSDSSTSDSLVVDTSGIYFVNVTDTNGCQTNDSISIRFQMMYNASIVSNTCD